MNSRRLYVAIISLVALATGAKVLASCYPTYESVLLFDTGCLEDRTVTKVIRQYITFPDTANTSFDVRGDGCCHPTSDELTCYPDFYDPVVMDGSWQQITTDKHCSTNPCAGGLCCSDLNSHIYTAEHECATRPPHTCGGSSVGGCNSGFTDLGGYCGRSYAFQARCAGPDYYDPDTCTCPDGEDPSPIVIDVDHSGFSMTSASAGVIFDMLGDSVPLQIAWTSADSTNAFLVLDRNGNGTIDNGSELFGNLTPQPISKTPNGFSALAEYDKPASGGNGDGVIDQRDGIFPRLRLWQDRNHNGISEAAELHPLTDFDVVSIDLAYKPSKQVDQYGNQFNYRSKVKDTHNVKVNRWAWDVFLKVQ